MVRSRRTGRRLTVAVTGADDGLGRRLVEHLAGPAAGAGDQPLVRALPSTDVPGAPPAGDLSGADVVVHLDASRDPAEPVGPRRARTVGGTAAMLEAARAAGVRRVVLVTSADVYRARPGQVPVPESAPVGATAEDSLPGDWVEVERLADHARRTGVDVVVLRPATLVGLGPRGDGALLRSLAAPRLLAVRGVEPLWQLCHADDLVGALVVAATSRVRGPCAVACPGWLRQADVEAMTGRRRLELPAGVAVSTAERLHRLGVTPGPPSELDVLLAPVVVDPARLRAAGWRPAWTNEQALIAHLADTPPVDARTAAYAAGAAGATVALIGTAALVRRARRRRGR